MDNNSTSNVYEETFFIVPRQIMKLDGLTFAYLKIYETIFQFWNKRRPCFLSNGSLQKRTGLSDGQTREALRFFERNGELKRIIVKGKRFLIQPEKAIETDCIDFEGGGESPPPWRHTATPPGGESPHNIKKQTNKELENNRDINAREPEQNSNKKNHFPDGTEKVESPPPDNQQEKEMIDPNFHHKDMLFENHPYLVTQSTSGYNLTLHELDTFERFKAIYPRKTAMERAKLQWFHDGCHLIADKIIEKLQHQVKRDKAFLDGCIPSAHKYILEKRYNDEVFEGSKKRTVDDNLKSTDWANPFA